MLRKIFDVSLITVALSAMFFLSGCDDSSSDESSESIKKKYLICAGRNPGGVGINLDSGESKDFDNDATFDWDVKIRTFKGKDTTAGAPKPFGGRPYIALRGMGAVKAYKYAEAGQTAFDGLSNSDVVEASFAGDTIDDVDKDIVPRVQHNGADVLLYNDGNPGNDDLKEQYGELVIGERFKQGAMDTNHDNDPIYIIKTDKGANFKVIINNFGPNSSLGESGYIELTYEKL